MITSIFETNNFLKMSLFLLTHKYTTQNKLNQVIICLDQIYGQKSTLDCAPQVW